MNITPCASRYPCYAPSMMAVGGMELMNAKGLGKGGERHLIRHSDKNEIFKFCT